MTTNRALGVLLAMICLLAPASAQVVFRGPYKFCMRNLGDVNRDGVPDYCANLHSPNHLEALSGRTGQKLYRVYNVCGGGPARHELGRGDVNGDGYPDFMKGIPDSPKVFAGDPVGRVSFTSGRDGKVMRRQYGAKKGDEFGYAIAMIGDQNNDGCSEYLVHIRRQGRGAVGSPTTQLYDGKSGRYRASYLTSNGVMYALGALGDLNGDKRSEWFACGRTKTYVMTLKAPGSSLVATIPIGAAGREPTVPIFSTHFDYDNDGSPDIAISDPHWTRAVYIYAAKDGKLLRTFKAPPGTQGRWGAAMEVLPDVNGDGVVDLLVAGDEASPNWWLHIISGRTGELMLTLHEPAYAKTFQRAPVVLGDLNGDGIPEVAVLRRDGEFIYDLQLAGKYGQGCASTPMAPVLRTDLPPRINGLFRLEVDNLLKTTRGLLVFGFSDTRWGSIPLPLGLGQMGMPGCQLLCSWDLADGFATTKGTNRWQWALPNSSKLIGRSIFSQVWAMDAKANPTGIATSNGLRNLVRR